MDNTLRLAVILLLQREDYEIKKEIEQVRASPLKQELIQEILKHRNMRIKAVSQVIEKLKKDISKDGENIAEIINPDDLDKIEEPKLSKEDEKERQLLENMFDKEWPNGE